MLSFNLNNQEFRAWVENELSGYKNSDSIPDYRHLKVLNRGQFMNTARRATNVIIPLTALPEKWREGIEDHIVRQSISSIEDLLQSGEGQYHIPWPAEAANLLSNKVYDTMACTAAWKEIQRSQLVNVVEAVRNRLLTIALGASPSIV